jgi:hypothetical protein
MYRCYAVTRSSQGTISHQRNEQRHQTKDTKHRHHTTQKDTTQKDTTQKDTTQKDTTQKDTTQKDTTQKRHQTTTPNKRNTYHNTHWHNPGPACTANWAQCNRRKCQGRWHRPPYTWRCGFWFLKIHRWPPWACRGRRCLSRWRCNHGFAWSPLRKPLGRSGRKTHGTLECLVCSEGR